MIDYSLIRRKEKTMNSKTQITTYIEYFGYKVKSSDNAAAVFCLKPGSAVLIVRCNK